MRHHPARRARSGLDVPRNTSLAQKPRRANASLRQCHQHRPGEALSHPPHPRGRVLILDELADSLGAEHRREVLDAIATVAKAHGITILATCQDAILTEARPYCGEILYFHYPSKSEPLNRPTRIFGVDSNGARVELTDEALTEGRNPM